MKVLLLGARGMLGQAIAKTWKEHEIIGMDLPEIDITQPDSIQDAIGRVEPDLLFNAAAYTAVDQCETDEAQADMVNGTAVGYLAKGAAMYDIPIIHISTDYVFEGTNERGYVERDEARPLNAYGRSKWHGEQELMAHAKKYWLIRTQWLYGPGGKNFVQTMLELGKKNAEVKVVNDQHGKPTFTEDLSWFIRLLVEEKAGYGIYHGVNEPETTWYDFATAIFHEAKMPVNVIPCSTDEFPRPAKRPEYGSLINTKRPKLRWWTEALADYLHPIRG